MLEARQVAALQLSGPRSSRELSPPAHGFGVRVSGFGFGFRSEIRDQGLDIRDE